MNGKKRWIPIVALGVILLSLLAILPAAGAGEVSFIAPDDIGDANDGSLTDISPEEQEWSRQGGQAGVLFEDEDLDRPLRRVLILEWDTTAAGSADIAAHSNILKSATLTDWDATEDGEQLIESGDYIYLGEQTAATSGEFRAVRKVVSVSQTQATRSETTLANKRFDITIEDAFPFSDAGQDIRRVDDDVTDSEIFTDNYKEIGPAEVVTFGGSAPPRVNLAAPILPSGISAETASNDLASRLDSQLDTRVNNDDIHVIGPPPFHVVIRNLAEVEDTGRVTRASNFGTYTSYYFLYWAAVDNHTGSAITVQSQAANRPQTYALQESNDGSGKFAAKIDLIPTRVTTDWSAFSPADAGETVTLTTVGGYTVEGYSGLKVKHPSGNVPDIRTGAVAVETVPDFSRTIPRLPVNERDSVTVNYPDGSETLSVETVKPAFSNFSPAHNSTGDDSRPRVSAQITDSDSGLKEADVAIVFATKTSGAANVDNQFIKDAPDNADVDEVSGGFEITARLDSDEDLDADGEIWWWAKATDKAGNVAYSDRLATKTNDDGDTEDDVCEATTDAELQADARSESPKCDPYIIKVDSAKPKMLHAETGRWWDASLNTGDSDDKTEYRVSKANKASVLVIFDEHLDTATVQASDFEVNDATPSAADAFNVKVRDDGESGDGNSDYYDADAVPQFVGQNRGYVFLTLSGDLSPNAQPKVEMVDKVSDLAGNQQSTLQTDAQANDRIGPALTVSIAEGNRPVTQKDVTLTVTADENIGTPKISFYKIESYSLDNGVSVQTRGSEQKASARFVSAREYSAKLAPSADGLYAVYVEAVDSAGNNKGAAGKIGTVGAVNGDSTLNGDMVLKTVSDVDGETDAILFERDKSVPKPDFDPSKPGSEDSTFETDDPNGFIRIDYSAEAREYTSASAPAREANAGADPPVTARGEMSGDDLDTHGRLTVVSATLDGQDIGADLNPNTDGNIFQYRLDGMAVGEYDLEITVRDEAGNTNAAPHKGTVKIIERKPYKLTLNPGWNLVSLPGQPADADINAVIPADHPIEAIRGYSPAVPGAWLIAEEGGDGTFSGTLETIDAGSAYWIKTGSFQALEVDIPKPTPGSRSLLPTIEISQGWNLVPILDVDGDFELAEQTASDNYFSGITEGSIAAIYTYNTVTNSWTSVAKTGVELGKGYWVYATEPGVIVP